MNKKDVENFARLEKEIAELKLQVEDSQSYVALCRQALEIVGNWRRSLPEDQQIDLCKLCRESRVPCFCGAHTGTITMEVMNNFLEKNSNILENLFREDKQWEQTLLDGLEDEIVE